MLRLVCTVLLLSSLGALGCGDGGSSGNGGTGGPGGTGGSGGTTLPPGPTCLAFCVKVVRECEAFSFSESSCVQGCETNIAESRITSEVCGDAVEAWFQCASELDCQGVYDWRDRKPLDDYPCRSAVMDVDLACPEN